MYHLSSRPVIAIILTSVIFAASCGRGPREGGPQSSQTAAKSLPQTDEPVVALVGRSLSGGPFLHFVLYGDGTVIFSDPKVEALQYYTVKLTAEQTNQLYASTSPDIVPEWDERTFTPSSTFLASYFLLIRDANGEYLRTATYSLPPYEPLFPEELRPPHELSTILDSLARYSAAGSIEWMPPEVEIQFTSAVPSPDDKAWWPKSWPQPKVDNKSQVEVLRLENSHAKELNRYLEKSSLLRLRGGTYEVWVRYPFPKEETLQIAMKNFPADR